MQAAIEASLLLPLGSRHLAFY